MAYGRVAERFFLPIFALTLALGFARPSPASSPASPATVPVTLLSVGSGAIQIQGGDGRAVTITYNSSTQFLRQGQRALPQEFSPGETVYLRRRTRSGGRAQAVLLCDPDSAAVIEAYRRRPLTGTLLQVSPSAWVVQPSEQTQSVPLTLLLTPATTFRLANAPATAAAFAPGSAVTIATRGLPNGMLSAVSVSEAVAAPAAKPRRGTFLSGLAADIQQEAGTLTVQDKTGATHCVAVDRRTKIKVRKQPSSLADIQPGMTVSVWLGSSQDATGNDVATSISASDAPLKKRTP